ncbi:MAG: acyl-CoA reductase, partial [Gammaproteobacteria bacterium]|nr:acyl-CoA reductase [Gammaproteobacteria bacterium]
VIFGFTYVLYNDVIKPLLSLPQARGTANGYVCHIGGWKKLEDEAVDRRSFAAHALHVFGVPENKVIDFYGFTEQMGVVYPSVDVDGVRIAPAFSDVIVRDVDSLRALPEGMPGLLEFVTPLPSSYPGIAVLTDDYGVVVSRDGELPDGRRGTLFKVIGRAKNVEVRGCGDIMASKVVRSRTNSAEIPVSPKGNRVLFNGQITFPMRSALESIDNSSLPETEISRLVDSVMRARSGLLSYSADERIEIVAAAAAVWGDPSGPLAPLRTQGLTFLQRWCEPERLRRLMDEGLRGRRGALDGLMSTSTPGRYITAVPRGLCAHWLSGNVPLLGMLALVQSIITGNANILKAASSFSGVLPAVLDSLSRVEVRSFSGRTLKGSDLAETIAVVYFDRNDRATAEALSKAADVRIAWGGREAVETIVDLPKKFDCEDVIFGPKLSFAVIGSDRLSTAANLKRIARRVATDCSVFDQHGCANPHTVFVESEELDAVEDFCSSLADEMRSAVFRIPKMPIDGGTAAAITAARLEIELGERGKIWRSEGTQWTILLDPDSTELAKPVYSRVVHVRRVRDAMSVAQLASSDIQTIGLALDPARRHSFARLAAHLGAVRFPEIGRMTEFDVAWDGTYLADRCVRWVTVGGPFA